MKLIYSITKQTHVQWIRGQNEQHFCGVLVRLHSERREVGVVIVEAEIILCRLLVHPPVVLHGPLLVTLSHGHWRAEGSKLPPTLLTPSRLCPLTVDTREL